MLPGSKNQLRDDFYPMNQDGMSRELFLYANALSVVRDHVVTVVANSNITREEAISQVEKDLRSMLDQRFRPQ